MRSCCVHPWHAAALFLGRYKYETLKTHHNAIVFDIALLSKLTRPHHRPLMGRTIFELRDKHYHRFNFVFQTAFHIHGSTINAGYMVFEFIDKNKLAPGILLDLSKALDIVNCKILLSKPDQRDIKRINQH